MLGFGNTEYFLFPLFLGAQGPQLQKVLERLTGQHTVPNVFIGKLEMH